MPKNRGRLFEYSPAHDGHSIAFPPVSTNGCRVTDLDEITSVKVNVQKQTTRVRFLFFFHRTKTTYEATVNVVGANVGVSKVEYRLENGIFWKNGDEFSSSREIGPFDIRVKDSNGAVTYWYYNGSTTVKLA